MSTFSNILKSPDLIRKILFTLFIIVVYRLGVHIPAPGVDLDTFKALSEQPATESGLTAYLTILTGSGMNISLFSLGILPYITASIMIQILTIAVPKLEEWQSQGAVGQKKINQWTRYITIVLGLIQSASIVFAVNRGMVDQQFTQLFPDDSLQKMSLAIFCMTVGVGIMMWMGELITEKGIANGMSILIFVSVISSLPTIVEQIYAVQNWFGIIVAVVIFIALVAAIVYIETGQRRIPVQYAKKIVGRKEYRGGRNFIPLKVNQAGVIPAIFASSLLQLPTILINFLPIGPEDNPNFWNSVSDFVQNDLYSPTSIWYILVFGGLIIGFTYFYNAISFDPARRADDLNKSGGFIPGVRPGPQTERYLTRILNRISLPGAIFLAIVALIPTALLAMAIGGGQSTGLVGFGGISIIIAVGVSIEIMKQINSSLMARNYEGFLK